MKMHQSLKNIFTIELRGMRMKPLVKQNRHQQDGRNSSIFRRNICIIFEIGQAATDMANKSQEGTEHAEKSSEKAIELKKDVIKSKESSSNIYDS